MGPIVNVRSVEMKPTEAYQPRVANERAFVILYDYAVDLELELEKTRSAFQKLFEELQATHIKLQELEAKLDQPKPKKKK